MASKFVICDGGFGGPESPFLAMDLPEKVTAHPRGMFLARYNFDLTET